MTIGKRRRRHIFYAWVEDIDWSIRLKKTMIKEEKVKECFEEERDIFLCDMRSKEALLSALPKNMYNHVQYLITSYEVWKDLEFVF